MDKSTLSELYELAKSISAEMAGVAPSRRLYDQVTGNANPKAGFGLNRDTADWAADIINNLVGTAGPSLYAASFAPKAAKTLADLAAQAPKVNRYLPKEMANQSGLYRYARPEEIKPGSNAFSARFDKKPRIEISDPDWRSSLKIKKMEPNEVRSLKEMLDNPDLYEQVPGIDKTKVMAIKRNSSGYAGGDIDLGIGDKGRFKPSVLTHELQHALQEEGGLARGGSPQVSTWANSKLRPELLKVARQTMDEWKPATYEQFWGKEKTEEGIKAYNKYLKDWNTKGAEAERWRAAQEGAPAKIYNNLAGEFEARDAASRMGLTPEQRITTPPYSSENIPLEDLIVRMK